MSSVNTSAPSAFHNQPNRLLRPAEAAQYLGLTLATIYSKASRRELPSVKVGRSLRFRLAALEKLIRAGERPALRPLRALVNPPTGTGGES